MDIQLQRVLSCSPAAAWQALTSPDALADWFWPESFDTVAQIDLRAGGRYRIQAERAGLAVAGEYITIEEPRLLAFTWQWDGSTDEHLVTVRLAPSGADTELTLTHERLADPSDCDHHVQGWSDCLDRLPGWLRAAAARS